MGRERRYTVRLATPEDVETLPEIERLAARLFKAHGEDLGIPDDVDEELHSVETYAAAQRAGHLWIATASEGASVGFARVREIDGYAHLDELDVLPAFGRQGIGSALLSAVCRWATAKGYRAVTLRTFRDVPWNAPFYEARGFRIVDGTALSAGHAGLPASERARGLRTEIRVTMARETRR